MTCSVATVSDPAPAHSKGEIMSTIRDQQEVKARATVIEIMNVIRQKYTENRPANGEKGEILEFSDLFAQMLQQEVLDFTETTRDEELNGEFAA